MSRWSPPGVTEHSGRGRSRRVAAPYHLALCALHPAKRPASMSAEHCEKGGQMSSRQLGMDGYISATCVVALVLTCAFLQVPDLSDLGRLLLFAGLATAAQLRPMYLSSGMKVTAEDVATFAAALTLGPFA